MFVSQQQKRDTAANWTASNVILLPGEIGHEIDTGNSKIGDGTSTWTQLRYWRPNGAAFGIFAVNDYRADPTGVNDSTAAFVAAYTAASNAGRGYVALGPGTYRVNGGSLTTTNPKIGLKGPGAAMCQVNMYGSGDLFYHYVTTFNSASKGTQGSEVGGFVIDGTNATGTAAGFHLQDTCGVKFDDFQCQNFTGAGQIGFHFTGNLGWSERLLFLRVVTDNCTTGFLFDGIGDPFGGVSFDYMRALDIYCNINPGQVGVQFQGFAQIDRPTFFYSYNANARAGGAASTALVIGPTEGSSETSRLKDGLFNIRGEKDGTGSLCYDMHVGTWAALSGTGVIQAPTMDAGAVNSGSVFIAGYINTPSLNQNHLLFSLPGGWSCYTAQYYAAPQTKGLSFLDNTFSDNLVKVTVVSGSGNPNGGAYYSLAEGDLFLRNDGGFGPNSQIYVSTANGSNAWQPLVAASIASGLATLTAGSSGAISNAAITANSIIRTFNVTAGGTVGALSVTKVPGTSFTIHSTSGTDTSTVYWEVVSY